MNHQILLYGIGLFLACFLVHLLIWRVRRPANDARMLFVIFLFIPAAVLAVIHFIPHQTAFTLNTGQILLLHFSLSAMYIASYPAAQAHSPTLDIFLILGSATGKKVTGDEIAHHYRSKDIVIDRLDDLRIYGLVSLHPDGLRLKPLAVIIIKTYICYRKLLGLDIGDG